MNRNHKSNRVNARSEATPKTDEELAEELLHRCGGSLKAVFATVRGIAGNKVGSPARGRKQCLDALIPFLQEEQAYRIARPECVFPKLTQGKMIRVTKERLRQKGITVGRDIDEKTIRDTCKRLILVSGDKNMSNYALSEWRWLIKKSPKEDRAETQKKVLKMIADLQGRMERENAAIATLSAKYPGIAVPPSVSRSAEYTKRLVKYFQKVAALFP